MRPDQQPRPRRLKASSRPLPGPAVVPEGGPLRELKRLLFDLYRDSGSPSYTSIAAAMAGRPGALGDTQIGEYLTESASPPSQQAAMTLAAVLAGPREPTDVQDQVRRLWVAAKDWVPPGIPIRELDNPLLLEVHEAIRVSGSQSLPVLPPYLERPHDVELRARLSAAVGQGRSTMVTLIGGSSTGKTRACWEAIHAEANGQEVLEGWRLWHPFDPTRPEAALGGIDEVGPRTVVWLNEAQHYLLASDSDLEERVAARLRTLLGDPDRAPVVVLGTLWPTYWDALTHHSRPRDPAQPDPNAQARQLLTGTEIVVPDSFSQPAVAALLEAAGTDPRLVEAATRAKDGELTQYLAGAPALLEHYETAEASANGLLTFAMDLRRLGHGSAIPENLLEAGTPAYLTDREWDNLEDDWFDVALRYTQQSCHGAHRPLTRIRPRPGEPDFDRTHYRLADYLEQIGQERRRSQIIPPPLWPTLVHHISNPLEAGRIGQAAANRLLYRCAFPLLDKAANAGDEVAARRLAELLSARGDEAGLWALAETGIGHAVDLLAAVLYVREDEAGLRALAETGNEHAAARLAWLLEAQGDEVGLRALAGAGSKHAIDRVVELLEARGDEAGMRALADTGNDRAAWRLAERLYVRGDEAGLRALAKAGAESAAAGPAKPIRTREDEAWLQILAEKFGDDTGYERAAARLAELLEARGDDAGLQVLAETGDERAAARLSWLLADRGDECGLRVLASTGNDRAAARLAELLYAREDDTGLQVLADTGDEHSAKWLAERLYARGDEAGLQVLAATGNDRAAARLAELLYARGDDTGLQGFAETRNVHSWRLAELMYSREDEAGLLILADTGNGRATDRLVELMEARGDEAGLRILADTGDEHSAKWLAERLYARGDDTGLQALAATGNQHAVDRLAELMYARGDEAGLQVLAATGNKHAAWQLAELLYAHGDEAGLRILVLLDYATHYGRSPLNLLTTMIAQQDQMKAEALHRYGLNPDGSTVKPQGVVFERQPGDLL